MEPEVQKKYRKRARKKVFGIPGSLWERALRSYEAMVKYNKKNPNEKLSIFEEELKNNMWIGLIAKTSKIAPRHVRLVMMYFYAALYILELTIFYMFQGQEYLTSKLTW